MDGVCRLVCLLAATVLSGLIAEAAWGQARILETEAISGKPFGVGRVTLALDGVDRQAIEAPSSFGLEDDDGRALYPVFSPGRVRRLIGTLLGGERNPFDSITVYFLFSGDGPLKLTLHTPTAQRVIVPVRERSEAARDRLEKHWWREYNAVARSQSDDGDYPPLVETFVTNMLGRRLGLEPPLLSRKSSESRSRPEETLDLFLGAERLRVEALEASLRSRAAMASDRPLPEGIDWPLVESTAGDDVPPAEGEAGEPLAAIEPIAMRVPADCFYIRFGKFANFLWLRKLLTDYGGDLANMITLRGHDGRLNQRLERQLAMRYTALADLVGDQLFSDVALIGYDMFQSDGAAIGMLYEARSPAVQTIFNQERSSALVREKALGASEEKLTIAGREVSFLSTPDNQVRSFYAIEGKHHLVTTSRAVVEAFYRCADSGASLGDNPDFRAARRGMEEPEDVVILAYFSRPFFQNLVSPQYQIELRRRLTSVADMQALEMARFAGAAEKLPDDSIDTLVRAGLLPRGFGWRAEGGEVVVSDGRASDSIRGVRGSFTPIPDMTIAGVTRSEAVAYAELADYYRTEWRQMDPLIATVRRRAVDDEGREQLVIDARVSLFAPDRKYGRYLSLLAPASTSHAAPAEGDIVSAQLLLQGGLADPSIPAHHVYLGLQDKAAAVDPGSGGWRELLKVLQSAPGYLGAYPRMGLLDWLEVFGVGTAVDEHGYSSLPLGLWRRQLDGFTTLSFDRELLETVTASQKIIETEPPAQVRLHAGDLSNAQVTPWLQALLFDRARRTSEGNARLFHALSQQLRTPVDRAPDVAERLLGVELVCPLAGKYELVEDESGVKRWISSGWAATDAATFQAPLLEWFRGLDGRVVKDDDTLALHCELQMQRKKGAPTFGLPLLDLFGGKKEKAGDDAKDTKSAPPQGGASPKQF